MVSKYYFKLYISGHSPKNDIMINIVETVFTEKLKERFALDIIDVSENPELALHANVFTTPTLSKHSPPPPSMAIGNFSNKEELLIALDMCMAM